MNQKQSYLEIFNQRGDAYNQASQFCPQARHIERQLLIDRLNIQPHHIVCDLPAGGGYLAEGLSPLLLSPQNIICVEPAEGFMKDGNPLYRWIHAPISNTPLSSNCVDRIGSLAGLHHLENTASFFQEAYRLLKPGGKIAVADVREGTDVDHFLNDAVNRLSETGHKGMFFAPGQFSSLLHRAGFEQVTEQHETYHWEFPDLPDLVRYAKMLFGLTKASLEEVEVELRKIFSFKVTASNACLPWSLQYATGVKPE